MFGLLNELAAVSAAFFRSVAGASPSHPRRSAAAPRGTGERIPPHGSAVPLLSAFRASESGKGAVKGTRFGPSAAKKP